MKNKLLILGFAIAIAFASCSKKDNPQPAPQPTTKGLFISNEGTFTYANSSLSYYDKEADTVANNLFFRVNGAPIGDVAQSLTIIGNDLYIVVNNSKYIYKVDAQTILYKAKIIGFTSPRYMLPVGNNKAYVSDLASPGLWSLDLVTYAKTLINTGKTTECMVKINNEVFVSNWSKSYVDFENNTVQVIDCVNDALVDEIEVAREPKAMVVDKNNNIWVICNGGWDPTVGQDPALICINPATREIVKRFDFTPGVDSPDGLAIDGTGENVFFMNGGYGTLNVYKMSVDATELPEAAFIMSEGRLFYGIKVDPQNGDIYLTDAKNYVQNGDLLHYSAEGELLGTFTLGIIPSYMLFN
ncbi:MAG: DUF5074 domain-containing protein [Bacteroidales bacterium]|nr:DUF5074 domain-containing protein [Bacteroidales bacterium]